jgi:hypothetical protein
MRYHIITIAALTVNISSLLAVTPIESELTQLQAQHAKALAAAVEPVNRRQIAALEMLQRKATQANDLDTAIKIKAELAKLGVATSAAAKPTQLPGADVLAKRLVGTKWVWFQKETVTFKANGKAEWVKGREPWSWKVENVENRVISGVHAGLNKKFTITFDEDFKKGRIAGEDGERSTRNVTDEP